MPKAVIARQKIAAARGQRICRSPTASIARRGRGFCPVRHIESTPKFCMPKW